MTKIDDLITRCISSSSFSVTFEIDEGVSCFDISPVGDDLPYHVDTIGELCYPVALITVKDVYDVEIRLSFGDADFPHDADMERFMDWIERFI